VNTAFGMMDFRKSEYAYAGKLTFAPILELNGLAPRLGMRATLGI
jgi:hypothetical protein